MHWKAVPISPSKLAGLADVPSPFLRYVSPEWSMLQLPAPAPPGPCWKLPWSSPGCTPEAHWLTLLHAPPPNEDDTTATCSSGSCPVDVSFSALRNVGNCADIFACSGFIDCELSTMTSRSSWWLTDCLNDRASTTAGRGAGVARRRELQAHKAGTTVALAVFWCWRLCGFLRG